MTVPAWLSKFPITGTWADHIARGSKGGIDWGAPAGTVIRSPSAGVVTYRTFADGSSVARVERPDRTATEFLHGRPILDSGEKVVPSQPIALSDGRPGQPGAGPSTGAHIHAHDVTAAGVRVPPFSTITTRRKGNTVNLFHQLGTSPLLFALAGGSPGTPANWLEFRDQALANLLAAQVGGNSAGLTAASFAAWKAAYLAPVNAGGATSGGDLDPAILDEILAAVKALNPPG